MDLGLGPDVIEGEDVGILVDLLGGNLATQDAREDVVGIIGHGSAPSQFLRLFFSSRPEMPSRSASVCQTSAGFRSRSAQRTRR